ASSRTGRSRTFPGDDLDPDVGLDEVAARGSIHGSSLANSIARATCRERSRRAADAPPMDERCRFRQAHAPHGADNEVGTRREIKSASGGESGDGGGDARAETETALSATSAGSAE